MHAQVLPMPLDRVGTRSTKARAMSFGREHDVSREQYPIVQVSIYSPERRELRPVLVFGLAVACSSSFPVSMLRHSGRRPLSGRHRSSKNFLLTARRR